jgi:hypothetical protein
MHSIVAVSILLKINKVKGNSVYKSHVRNRDTSSKRNIRGRRLRKSAKEERRERGPGSCVVVQLLDAFQNDPLGRLLHLAPDDKFIKDAVGLVESENQIELADISKVVVEYLLQKNVWCLSLWEQVESGVRRGEAISLCERECV